MLSGYVESADYLIEPYSFIKLCQVLIKKQDNTT